MPHPRSFIVAQLSSTTTPALTTTYAVRPAYANGTVMAVGEQGIGSSETQTFAASVTEASGGGFTGITFEVQVSADGANSTTAAATNWKSVKITNLNDGTVNNVQSVSVGAGATAVGVFGGTNCRNMPFTRVIVKSTGANAGAGDLVTVKAFVS